MVRQACGPSADPFACAAKGPHCLIIEVTACHYQIEVAPSESLDHWDEERLIVLQIGIQNCEVTGLRRQHSLQTSTGKSAPRNAADAAHTPIRFSERSRDR